MESAPTDSREKSILELAAQFWETDRIQAFRACYDVMRAVDDIVDNRRALQTPIDTGERRQIEKSIHQLLTGKDQRCAPCVQAIVQYRIPRWPWRLWQKAMYYDLRVGYFPTYRSFMRYAEGAAVSPGAIFMHLCAVRKSANGYQRPQFNIRNAARPLALFSYHVHILRDLREDAENGICFIPDDLLAVHGLSRRDFLQKVTADPQSEIIRAIQAFYLSQAQDFSNASEIMLQRVKPQIEERYAGSLQLLYEKYALICRKYTYDLH